MSDLFDWQPPKYPAEPGYKEHGTSKDAAEKMKKRAPGLRVLVLAELKEVYPRALTADQIARRLKKSVLAIRPRVTELYKTGLIKHHGERQPNVSGVDAYACQWVKDAD
jgi:predicted transcriptional regulator